MIKSLSVWWDDALVGGIQIDEHGDLAFIYASGWLADPQKPAVSISLPKRPEPFGRRETRPFFAGLLPEEGQRDDLQIQPQGGQHGQGPAQLNRRLAPLQLHKEAQSHPGSGGKLVLPQPHTLSRAANGFADVRGGHYQLSRSGNFYDSLVQESRNALIGIVLGLCRRTYTKNPDREIM